MSKARDYKSMWHTFAQKKARGYLVDKFNPRYSVGFRNLIRHKMLMDALELSPTDWMLDAGCASGYQSLAAASQAQAVDGIDLGDGFIRTAHDAAQEQNMTNLFFQICSIEALAFKSATFDRVLCAEVLEHVLQPAVTLAELARVLKNDGRLVVSVPNENGNGTWWRRIKGLVFGQRFQPLEDFSMEAVVNHGDAHLRKFDRASLARFFEEHGLRVRRIRGCGIIDFPFYDQILNRLNRFAFFRSFLLNLELFLSRLPLLVRLSRNLIVVAELPREKNLK